MPIGTAERVSLSGSNIWIIQPTTVSVGPYSLKILTLWLNLENILFATTVRSSSPPTINLRIRDWLQSMLSSIPRWVGVSLTIPTLFSSTSRLIRVLLSPPAYTTIVLPDASGVKMEVTVKSKEMEEYSGKSRASPSR